MLRIHQHPESTPAALEAAGVAAVLEVAADERLTQMIEEATALAERISRRHLWRRTYEALVETSGQDLYLPARPIESVVSVTREGDDTALDASDYQAWESSLRRSSSWYGGPWLVRWVGGFWLPSDGDTPTAGAWPIGSRAAELQRAIREVVIASYRDEARDPTIRRTDIGGMAELSVEYNTRLTLTEDAIRVFRSFAPVVA